MAAGADQAALTRRGALAASACAVALAGGAPRAWAVEAPRERLLLDEGWRFQKDDPPGASGLSYDVRPQVKTSEDGKAADARPQEAEAVRADGQRVLKPWILPTANPFIGDPAKRHQRPAGDPGGEVPFVQPAYDDSRWQAVTLPHDWAIEGPWLTTGPYGGMGRLPSWGVGWYRRKLDIPVRDRGRSIFLDVDGPCPTLPSG